MVMCSYYVAVFLSAFLLFQVQPMLSKALLPGFGGSYLVWGGCMVFFQGMLLVGYILAHVAQRRLGVRRYSRIHGLMLLAPLLFFPFNFEGLGPVAGNMPMALEVFRILFGCISLPFLTLSMTSLVLQRWLSISDLSQRKNPYVLYAVSNLGSMLALLSYPTLVEPFLSLKMQGYVWWGGYLVAVLLHIPCLPKSRTDEGTDVCEEGLGHPPAADCAVWFLLSASACASLLAVTNVITFDIASVPFLWVLPLAVYLTAFVMTFKEKAWYPVWMRQLLSWSVLTGVLLHLMTDLRLGVPAPVAMFLYLGILFVICVNCTGKLVERRPSAHGHLTAFYLVLAAGGLFGSLIISWVIPLISSSLVEYPLSFFFVLLAIAACGERVSRKNITPAGIGRVLSCAAVVALSLVAVPWMMARVVGTDSNASLVLILIALPLALSFRCVSSRPWESVGILGIALVCMSWTGDLVVGAHQTIRIRNYYGVYRIYDRGPLRYLQHGTTQHGRQYIEGHREALPLSYYHPSTPVASVLTCEVIPRTRVAMVGLGTGAVASYIREGQGLVVYELDPDNLPVAKNYFSYLDIAEAQGAQLEFVFGDGRVSLRDRKNSDLDILIIDAFNSGSIPVHLLTVEAFEEYFDKLGPHGVLLMHVSNKILDLVPVVYSNAGRLGLLACEKALRVDVSEDADVTLWMALTKNGTAFKVLTGPLDWRDMHAEEGRELPKPWTDQYCNILGAMF
jgi:spermidine synthase